MIDRIFLKHPRSVNESYGEHMRAALSFGVTLLGAAGAAFVHAFIPALYETTASRAVTRLHRRMVTHRVKNAPAPCEQEGGAVPAIDMSRPNQSA